VGTLCQLKKRTTDGEPGGRQKFMMSGGHPSTGQNKKKKG